MTDEDWEKLVEDAIERMQRDPRMEVADLFKTENEVFDLHTMKALHKLISDRYIDTLDFPLSTGKEANVFRATTPEGTHLAVKIYRVHTRSFRSHLSYLYGDPRFDPKGKSKREIVELWASKELKNLHRFQDAGCLVPTPVTVHRNVLLMELIGHPDGGAPHLKDIELDDPAEGCDRLLSFVEQAWEEGDLVHGDLSEFNVLAWDGELVVIDAAQAVVSDHPRAAELLRRDVEHITDYFGKLGVDRDPEPLLDRLLESREVAG